MGQDKSSDRATRMFVIDLLNTVFIAVVLFLHISDYTINYFQPVLDSGGYEFLQKLAVGGFIFLSGYKLARSKSQAPVRAFITNRFIRIYMPYLVALLAASFTYYPYFNQGDWPSFQNFLMHAFVLQSVFPNLFQTDYLTLWYVSVLFCCYAFFLATRRWLTRLTPFAVTLALVSLAVLALQDIAPRLFHMNLFLFNLHVYLVYFGLGMIYANWQERTNQVPNKFLISTLFLSFAGLMLLLKYTELGHWYLRLAYLGLLLMCTVPLYILSFKIVPMLSLPSVAINLCRRISYASFFIFLFQRSVWEVMADLWTTRSFYHWLYIVVVGTALIVVASYALQRLYDRVIDRCLRSGGKRSSNGGYAYHRSC